MENDTMANEGKNRHIPLVGILLILLGLILLLGQFGILDYGFWTIVTAGMVVYGAVLVIRSFSLQDRNKVFWGTVLFLAGLYFLLHSLGMIAIGGPAFIPVVFLILGFAFLMSYFYRFSDWHLLIPALFFIFLGGIIFAEDVGYLREVDVTYYLSNYWPILLIMFGAALVLKARKKISQ
jgi:hypothetical protein